MSLRSFRRWWRVQLSFEKSRLLSAIGIVAGWAAIIGYYAYRTDIQILRLIDIAVLVTWSAFGTLALRYLLRRRSDRVKSENDRNYKEFFFKTLAPMKQHMRLIHNKDPR